jgi:quinoprotein relay system zinc metallohydrolase 2
VRSYASETLHYCSSFLIREEKRAENGTIPAMARHSRRTFLTLTGAAVMAGAGGARGGVGPILQTIEIAPGIYVASGRHELITPQNGGHISSTSFIVGSQCVAVVDTGGSAGVGRGLLAAIRQVTDRPLRYVINTHMHPDHVFGNGPLVGPQTEFAGHAKLARALAARGERYLAVNKPDLSPEDFAGTIIVPPTIQVETSVTLDLGERNIVLQARKTAHTDNDLTVRDVKTNTLFLGDLLFSGHVPTLDGSIKGWQAVLAELKTEPAARVVPGHGPASMAWPDAMTAEAHYLESVTRDVRAAIKSGRALDDAMKTAGESERGAWLLFDDFHKRNIAAAFAELEWE